MGLFDVLGVVAINASGHLPGKEFAGIGISAYGAVSVVLAMLVLKEKVSGGQWVSAAKEYVFPDNQWTPFAPRLEVFEVPGDHDSMVLEPNVRVMAARIRKLLAAGEPAAPLQEAAE